MDLRLNSTPTPEAIKADSRQAAQALGALLRQTPEYDAFLKVYKAINSDLTIQKLQAQIRANRNALQWGRDEDGQHANELDRLELEMETLPLVKEYRQVEDAVCRLFYAVDEIISQEAGVAFAVNAKRSGCCGG